MSRKITCQILFTLILTYSVKLNAQQWLGRTTGNYSGTYGIYSNASSIADSKYKYYFNFWGRGVNFYNNYLLYNAPIKVNQWGNGNYNPEYLDLNGKTKYYSFNQDIWGPGFMFPISRNVNMSINMRQRNSIQYFGISESVARMGFNGIDSNSSIYNGNDNMSMNTFYHNGKFGSNMQSNQELSISVAGILAKNEHHQLTGGATLKLIRGLGAAYAKGTGFDVAATGNNAIQIQNADVQYAYTDSRSVIEPFNKPYGLFSLQSKGFGAGADLGLTYTYTAQKGKYATDKYCNDNAAKSDYDIKIAAAFNDLGGIRFNKDAVKYNYSDANTANIIAPPNTFNDLDYQSQNGFDTIGKYVFDAIGANKSSKFNTSLPTAFNLQADFRLADHFYTALVLNQSLKGINSTGIKSTSMLSVIPRIETRLVEVSMPLTLSENYKNFYIGAYLRVGPVFIGSDNLGGLLKVASKTPFRGADIYGGVSFGLDQCHKWFYNYLVEPTYIDTVKQKDTIVKKDSIQRKDTIQQKDTIKSERKDTIRIIQHDTIKIKVHDTIFINKKTDQPRRIIHDTIYIEKKIRTKADIELENILRKKEADIIIRQKELDERERILRQKETVTNRNDSGALKKCYEYTNILYAENTTLKNKTIKQADDIIRLRKQIDSLNKINTLNDATIVKAKTDKTKTENEIKAANKKADSLQTKLNEIIIILNNCQKNNTNPANDEIIKLKADRTKAENEAKAANKKADSLQAQLNDIIIVLNNCQKTSAEIGRAKAEKEKAEKDADAANKKADSLQSKLDGIQRDLTDCKKNNTQIDVTVVKLKKAEEDKLLYKTELDAANKNILALNAKIYRRDATIDSLMAELAKCGNKSDGDNAELLKKCNDEKATMHAEIISLKNKVIVANNSLDSITTIVINLKKDKSILEGEIAELNARIKNSNCDTLKIQIEEKNKAINEIKIQNTTLQNKINSLTTQLNQLKAEFQLVNIQNQNCTKKLDSCMHGLSERKDIDQKPPIDDKGIDKDKGGPMEGNTNSNDDVYHTNSKDVNTPSDEESNKGKSVLNVLTTILKTVIAESSTGNTSSTNSQGTPTNSGNNKTNTETIPGSTKTNTENTGGRNTTGTNTTPSSTRRR